MSNWCSSVLNENDGRILAVNDWIKVEPSNAKRFVFCMPACDEEERIASSLVSVMGVMQDDDVLVLVVNGSNDRTAPIATKLLSRSGHQFALFDFQWQADRGSAPHARRVALEIGYKLAPNGVLVSIDADTQAELDLRRAYDAEFAGGADLVCGAIAFDPIEAAQLPPGDPRHEFVVREYRAASREIAALINPDPENPWPNHGNIGGANFAVRASAYRAIGGLPTPPFGEDRALLRIAEAQGLHIRFSDTARVTTSCRLTGKAPGGLADELRRSRDDADPIMDEALEPAHELELRLRVKKAFFRAIDDDARRSALAPLELSTDGMATVAATHLRGEAWQKAEELSARLRRTRMRRSELQRELPTLTALRDRLRSDKDNRSCIEIR